MKLINNNILNCVSEGMYHQLKSGNDLYNPVFRYGSEAWISLMTEAKDLHDNNCIQLSADELVLFESFSNEQITTPSGDKLFCNIVYENEEYNEFLEAEYNGTEVELNKPKRGGSKKFYVYVKNPKTGNVIKVEFGAKDGGQNLKVKLSDPKARANFAARHNCELANDPTKPSYWSCRLPRFAKLVGLSGNGKWW